MIHPDYAARQPVHTPWSPSEIARLRFLRWAVLRRKMTEGETDGQLVDFRRFHHVYMRGDRPRVWDHTTVEDFERMLSSTAGRRPR